MIYKHYILHAHGRFFTLLVCTSYLKHKVVPWTPHHLLLFIFVDKIKLIKAKDWYPNLLEVSLMRYFDV